MGIIEFTSLRDRGNGTFNGGYIEGFGRDVRLAIFPLFFFFLEISVWSLGKYLESLIQTLLILRIDDYISRVLRYLARNCKSKIYN